MVVKKHVTTSGRHSVLRFVARADLVSIITAPVIYSLIVLLLIVDLWVSVYQAICFRAYGIARVRRRDTSCSIARILAI